MLVPTWMLASLAPVSDAYIYIEKAVARSLEHEVAGGRQHARAGVLGVESDSPDFLARDRVPRLQECETFYGYAGQLIRHVFEAADVDVLRTLAMHVPRFRVVDVHVGAVEHRDAPKPQVTKFPSGR
jgi:hypothetical protein